MKAARKHRTKTGNPIGRPRISLAGGTVAVNGSCTFSVNVTATTAGTKNNTSSNVASANAGTGNTANDTLVVLAQFHFLDLLPPGFGPASAPVAICGDLWFLEATSSYKIDYNATASKRHNRARCLKQIIPAMQHDAVLTFTDAALALLDNYCGLALPRVI